MTTVFKNKVRGLVSKEKVRYKENGYDLDLTYITGATNHRAPHPRPPDPALASPLTIVVGMFYS